MYLQTTLIDAMNIDYKAIIAFVIILIITFILARWFNRFFKRFVLESSAVLENDPTNYHFIRHIIIAMIYIVGFTLATNMVPSLRSLSNSLLAGASILAVAVGFASQKAFSNVISGMFLVIFKPFRLNQTISIGADIVGKVEDITLRHTVLINAENKRIIIPNAFVSDAVVVNASAVDEKICRYFEIRIAYNSDLDKAIQIIKEEAVKHSLCIDNRSEQEVDEGVPQVNCRVVALEDLGLRLRAWVWTKTNGDGFILNCDLNKIIVERFRNGGIEIPIGPTGENL